VLFFEIYCLFATQAKMGEADENATKNNKIQKQTNIQPINNRKNKPHFIQQLNDFYVHVFVSTCF